MKIIDVIKATPKSLEVPYEVWTTFGSNCKTVLFAGKMASLGEDFKSISKLRLALEWYVDQLGGKVKWGKE